MDRLEKMFGCSGISAEVRTPLTLLRKGICGSIQECLVLTPALVIDVRSRRLIS